MSFLPHTCAEEKAMLQTMGVSSVDALFGDIPAELCLDRPLHLPPGLSEKEAWEEVEDRLKSDLNMEVEIRKP